MRLLICFIKHICLIKRYKKTDKKQLEILLGLIYEQNQGEIQIKSMLGVRITASLCKRCIFEVWALSISTLLPHCQMPLLQGVFLPLYLKNESYNILLLERTSFTRKKHIIYNFGIISGITTKPNLLQIHNFSARDRKITPRDQIFFSFLKHLFNYLYLTMCYLCVC